MLSRIETRHVISSVKDNSGTFSPQGYALNFKPVAPICFQRCVKNQMVILSVKGGLFVRFLQLLFQTVPPPCLFVC